MTAKYTAEQRIAVFWSKVDKSGRYCLACRQKSRIEENRSRRIRRALARLATT